MKFSHYFAFSILICSGQILAGQDSIAVRSFNFINSEDPTSGDDSLEIAVEVEGENPLDKWSRYKPPVTVFLISVATNHNSRRLAAYLIFSYESMLLPLNRAPKYL